MPTLNWIGKDKVVNHATAVPFHVLEHVYNFGGASENKIIHGDNLLALKSLLLEYEGRVKCIYIDPPYNTGNEDWIYNDKVNSPQIKKWLGEVVGKEGEDLSRHDKWLCMMYPRLKLLKKLLADDGAIFISIDDNEQANLKLICDEIFGVQNFVANIAWEKRYTRSNNAKMFYSIKDSILAYRKSDALFVIKEPRTEKANSNYSNPDNDPRGAWMTSSYVNPATKNKRPNLVYEIESPDGRKINHPTHAWKFSYDEYMRHKLENKLWWGSDGTATYPRLKNFLNEMPGMVPVDLWHYKDAGTTDDAGNILKQIFGTLPFDTPKPPSLIEKILQLVTNKNSIVLDSFAGSGTTAHAVLNLNAQDGGNRKFILVEMENYAERITAERVRRVIQGYGQTPGTGGSFDFYEVGEPLMIQGNLNENIDVEKIHAYIWYTETRTPYKKPPGNNPAYLGDFNNTAYYFHYNREQRTTLDAAFLRTIEQQADSYLIYADECGLNEDFLQRNSITFKKIPRDIKKIWSDEP